MFEELKEVLRLIMLKTKQNKTHGLKTKWNKKHGLRNSGGLLVLIWTETDHSVLSLNCTVAAAGPWCAGIKMEELHPDVMNRLHGYTGPCAEPDIEDLYSFTDLHGPLNVFLSFLINDALQIFRPNWQCGLETFFHAFSLVNAEIRIYLKFKIDEKISELEFSQLESSKIVQYCYGGHPDVGEKVLLTIPLKATEQDLFGTLTIQPVTLLRPCVLQYPNVATNLSEIKILVYSPSNLPVTRPSPFLQNLPASLNCQQLGLQSDCLLTFQEYASSGTVYTIKQIKCFEPSEKAGLLSIDQSLMLFLFLHHTDPFTTDISDLMTTELLLERHLEDILNNNKEAITNVITKELKKFVIVQNKREKDQEKMRSACEVIVSSCISIISGSNNMEFRSACLKSLKVDSTHHLSVAFSESLRKVTFWKFASKKTCCSDQVLQQTRSYKRNRVEM